MLFLSLSLSLFFSLIYKQYAFEKKNQINFWKFIHSEMSVASIEKCKNSTAVTINVVQRGYFLQCIVLHYFPSLYIFLKDNTWKSLLLQFCRNRQFLGGIQLCCSGHTIQFQALCQDRRQEERIADTFLLTLQGQTPGVNEIHYPQDIVLITAITAIPQCSLTVGFLSIVQCCSYSAS